MDFVYIGKIVGTHGIKGEIRILSNFDKKELVFVPHQTIYVGNQKEKLVITSYRKHKNFDMITLEGYDNINQVLIYKNMSVYVLRSDLHLNKNDYVIDDLLGMKICSNLKEYGVVHDIYSQAGKILLEIIFDKKYYIPYNDRYIKKVNLEQKTIEVVDVEDLIL